MSKKNNIYRKTAEEIEYDKRIEKYVKYIEENLSEVTDKVSDFFDERTNDISSIILRWIKASAANAIHYEWEPDDCSYDSSGVIKEDGIIDKNISIMEFLENEYTGAKEATYTSGRGFHYTSYDDMFSYRTLELGEKMMRDAVKDFLNEKFCSDNVDEKDAENVILECHDIIYDNCPATKFFTCAGALIYCSVDLGASLKLLFEESEKIIPFNKFG